MKSLINTLESVAMTLNPTKIHTPLDKTNSLITHTIEPAARRVGYFNLNQVDFSTPNSLNKSNAGVPLELTIYPTLRL